MESNPRSSFSAYSWSKMDNIQRHAVVRLFEREYGPDFAHKAKFGNEYAKPAVAPGKCLSGKKNLMNLDSNLDEMLSKIVDIRAMRPVEVRFPVVRPLKRIDGAPLFGVYLIAPNGASMAESIHFTEDAAKNQMRKMNELLSFSALGARREIRKMADADVEKAYCVFVWNYDEGEYVPHPEFPIHQTRESAIDRAAHDTRFTAAFCVQWETWNAAGCSAPEKYEYFERENVLVFDKKALLKGHADPRCSDCWNLAEAPYWKKLTDSAVDEAFLDFCSKL